MFIQELHRIVSFVVGAGVLSIGALVLVGYMLDVHSLHSWNGSTSMALPTAICFVTLGVDKLIAILARNSK